MAGSDIDADAPELFTTAPHGLLVAFGVHGFAPLADYAAGDRTAEGDAFWTGVIERWLRDCATPREPAWHPFPLSGRVIAWCAALSGGDWPPALQDAMHASLGRHLLLLRRGVEHDVGGNHVLRNAAALVVGGACLGDGKALRAGERLLDREVPRQLLPAGGHEERSPSYHREILGDLRAAVTVLKRAGRSVRWAERLDDMAAWLSALAAPDGSLPLRGDAWEGPPITPATDPVTELDGLVVLRGDNLHAVMQCGPLGPPHLPPHVHADALSFSLWADGGWVVVDPGAFTYAGPERDAFRGTSAHATLTVDGADQCRFWGAFRASRLPSVSHGPVSRDAEGWLTLEARHDGYGPLVHVRHFAFHPERGLVVRDRIEGGTAAIESRLPLGSPTSLTVAPLDGEFERVDASYSPYLGSARPIEVLLQRRNLAPGQICGWSLTRTLDC